MVKLKKHTGIKGKKVKELFDTIQKVCKKDLTYKEFTAILKPLADLVYYCEQEKVKDIQKYLDALDLKLKRKS